MKYLIPLLCFISAPAFAQAPPAPAPATRPNTPSDDERSRAFAAPVPPQQTKLSLVCTLQRPSQVQRFFIQCAPGTAQLDVAVADCCIPGDHWQVKVKSWDAAPKTAGATAPGPGPVFGVPARVFNYGGPHELRALIECSYLHGINVFPAGAFITVTSPGACTNTNVGLEDIIDRAP